MEPEAEMFLQSVKEICPNVTEHGLSLFTSKFTIEKLDKKDFFLICGKVQNALGFIAKGFVRSFY